MGKWVKMLDIVFHPTVFAIVFLACLALAIINIIYSVLPHPWGMLLFAPLVGFGFLGYLIDERRHR